jgi:hypothetical protein
VGVPRTSAERTDSHHGNARFDQAASLKQHRPGSGPICLARAAAITSADQLGLLVDVNTPAPNPAGCADGFISDMSRCDGPPLRWIMMTDFRADWARVRDSARRRDTSPRTNPLSVRPPTRRTPRRVRRSLQATERCSWLDCMARHPFPRGKVFRGRQGALLKETQFPWSILSEHRSAKTRQRGSLWAGEKSGSIEIWWRGAVR